MSSSASAEASHTGRPVAAERGGDGGGGRSTLRGAVWSAVNTAAQVLLPLGLFVFFARVLPPPEIGVVALATALAEIAKALGAPGAYEALLQQREDQARCHETASFVLLVAGATLVVAFVAACVLAGSATGASAAHLAASCAIGLRIPFDLWGLQPQAALAQRLAFRRLALRSVVGNLLAGSIGVAVALFGLPLAGLVTYLVGQSVVGLAGSVLGTGALARPRLHRDCLARMRREAGYATGVRLVATANNQLDQVLVAGLVGSAPLGYYNVAKRVETAFITASASFSGILFQPLFARSAGDGAAARGAVLGQGLAVTTATSGLAAAFLLVNAADAVGLVFGARWLPAAPLVALAALAGYLRALGGVHGALLSVTGHNGKLLALAGVSAAAGGLIVLGTASREGLSWMAGALALRNAGFVLAAAAATARDVRGSMRAYLLDVLLPAAAMLAGALAGRRAALLLLPPAFGEGSDPLRVLLVLALSAVAAALSGLATLGLRHAVGAKRDSAIHSC